MVQAYAEQQARADAKLEELYASRKGKKTVRRPTTPLSKPLAFEALCRWI